MPVSQIDDDHLARILCATHHFFWSTASLSVYLFLIGARAIVPVLVDK